MSEEARKVHWGCTICLDRSKRVLCVQREMKVNFSILRKWYWKLKVDQEVLWYKLLSHNLGGRAASS